MILQLYLRRLIASNRFVPGHSAAFECTTWQIWRQFDRNGLGDMYSIIFSKKLHTFFTMSLELKLLSGNFDRDRH